MSRITTHVLDTSRGRPAAGVAVALERETEGGWIAAGRGTTDADGRVKDLMEAGAEVEAATYRLTFETGAYFAALGVESFYPRVVVVFSTSAGEHYHVPVLVNPFGYSTYRGS
ncbi:MAG: hydroxyisourate hydrolase [Acidobacteria bacterium]|nr:hydroxyisourate hydrolase [Acidobacteriota bacterium]MCA1642033.1 hydroxyisourate hydrolase [Acidobacteriota bacterium]